MLSWSNSGQSGSTLIETLVAMALLGAIAVTFLSGLTTISRVSIITDEKTTAESLARSQMEWVKRTGYVTEATEYSAAPIPDDTDYAGYSATIVASPLHGMEDGIQRINVTIRRHDNDVISLEGYKVDR